MGCSRAYATHINHRCPIGGVANKVIKTIEEAGAVVVALENCQGYKELHEEVAEDIDPVEAIANKYLNIPCSVMTPNKGPGSITERYDR